MKYRLTTGSIYLQSQREVTPTPEKKQQQQNAHPPPPKQIESFRVIFLYTS